ncbi:hypothetical protein BDP27DRAFT_1324383 [Rhodocollybia butyracea]|uniref:Uncharacterized protein n=1 Tax=Rhodocollybia butyracea TaxID=206335 RepID=A0A9P5U7Q0_9AGAR|nr:hypothetical protein BDP27DRAFT_1324383 [Rhodocollybia butyracea]
MLISRPTLETNPTSASGDSVYFEAPLAHFPMAQSVQDPNLPVQNDKEVNLNREPTVAGGVANDALSRDVVDDDEDPDFADGPESHDIAAHPNGSEGWLPATDIPLNSDRVVSPSSLPVRSASVLKKRRPASIASKASSTHGEIPSSEVQRNRSIKSVGSTRSKRSMFTNVEGRRVEGSTFINGAGTTGPYASAVPADDSLQKRMQSADSSLNPKQKKKIGRAEVNGGKRLSKVIKQESKAEKQSLELAIQQLGELQNIQQAAVKREAKAHSAHAKALAAFHKAEEAYLAARAKYEIAQAAMQAEADILDITRNNARGATENMQDKAAEVDGLRKLFGLDEREREVVLSNLKGKPKDRKGSGFFG